MSETIPATDLQPIITTAPNPTKLAMLLHLILCKQNHTDPDGCQWYIEDQQVERWEMPSHKKWLERAEGVVLMSEQSEEEITQMIETLLPLITQLNFLRNQNQAMGELIEVILNETKD